MLGISELAVLLVVVIVVLGAKRLPELARSAGKAARILKSEARAMRSDGTPDADGGAPRIVRAAPGDVVETRSSPGPDGDARR
ncbi:twin-arginine translocase TatA/TatE family subunit [Streptomyces sp. TRM43335]|uniref:Sec-independent protein translocase protein TatA n=1 Tax=Streptomyces taklimakanensis TaxID=2569853 RepID=A0A6G2BH21_9ACTN|nr:twin-arginine translocase TatA/TatE family subunit [Streptomyces taklimakanensis]MTE21426.1 twin-arginine translocase TatA/TatE family subunit [Streptomyces taklimakanensis]